MKKRHGNLTRLAVVSIEEFLPYVASSGNRLTRKRTVNIKGYEIRVVSKRLATFARNGTICQICGLKGEYFAIEVLTRNPQGLRPHINLYGYDSNGDEVLLTSDHIIPRIKNGHNGMSNRQTLCKICNELKGCTI